MNREQVIEALHEGMALAVRDYHAWTNGASIEEWGVESLLTAACAGALAKAAKEEAHGPFLTLEQTFAGLLEYSERYSPSGRPTKAAARLKSKPTGRMDIVIWNRAGTPRAVIEVKRSDGTAGLKEDAERVAGFITTAGRLYDGSVRYGAVATLIHASTREGFLRRKEDARSAVIFEVADKAGLKCRMIGPREIHDPTEKRDRSVWSYVFLFEG